MHLRTCTCTRTSTTTIRQAGAPHSRSQGAKHSICCHTGGSIANVCTALPTRSSCVRSDCHKLKLTANPHPQPTTYNKAGAVHMSKQHNFQICQVSRCHFRRWHHQVYGRLVQAAPGQASHVQPTANATVRAPAHALPSGRVAATSSPTGLAARCAGPSLPGTVPDTEYPDPQNELLTLSRLKASCQCAGSHMFPSIQPLDAT